MMADVKGFLGVYAHNQVDSLKPPKKGDSLIMNLDDSNQAGSHWVAFYFSPLHACYFDSFGVPPDNRSLKYLRKYDKPVIYSKIQLQEDQSSECGFYCMTFIRLMTEGNTFKETIQTFHSHPGAYNEKMAVKDSE